MTEAGESKARFNSYASPSLQQRVRATVRGVAKVTDTDYTLSQFTEDALQAHCERLEHDYNKGRRWPIGVVKLRPGARMK